MQNKAPQGKPDPIPTPEQELEKYGVWVKAEPQDILDDSTNNRETIDELSIEGSEAILLPEEDEDDELLDSFDLPEETDEASISDGDIDTFSDDDFDAFEDLDALSPLEEPESLVEMTEDPETFDFEALEALEPETPIETTLIELDEDVIEDGIIDIELDELDYEEPVSESRVIPPQPASAQKASSTDNDAYATTEINIEDFGFSDDGTSDSSPSLENFGSDFSSSVSDEAAEGIPVTTDDFEPLDIDLQFDDTIPEVETHESTEILNDDIDGLLDVSSEFETIDIDSIGNDEPASAGSTAEPERKPMEHTSYAFQGSSLDSFIDDDDTHESGIMPDLAVENVSISDEEIGFDDIQAVSDDLSEHGNEPSSNLLQKIALELSSIKEELVSLRGQLSSLKASGVPSSSPELDSDEDSFEDTKAGGFFDDEDDDTIALTGDELDNILNTADFTEEAVDESLNELEAPQLELPDDIELLPEDGDYTQPFEPGIEVIDLPMIDPTDEEKNAIDVNEGVTPLTSEPDDTSFLDADSDDELMELEGMDFVDIALIEPEESDLDILEDSTFGDDFDDEELPILEDGNEDIDSEIVLDIDAGDTPVVSTVDSFAEPIEEIEDAMELEELLEPEELGGLSLHSEESGQDGLELEAPEEIDAFEFLDAAEFDDMPNDPISPPSKPVDYHPDELVTSLDDSLFVDSATHDQPLPEADVIEDIFEETSFEELLPLDESTDQIDDLVMEPVEAPDAAPRIEPASKEAPALEGNGVVPDKLKRDVKSVLLYLDQLLASLPEEKIEEFASSEYYDTYKHLFDDLGLL